MKLVHLKISLIVVLTIFTAMLIADSQTSVVEESFSELPSFVKWKTQHFRGDAMIFMLPDSDKGNRNISLHVKGQGKILDSLFTQLPELTGNNELLKVSYRYKATKSFPIKVAISSGAGCVMPFVRYPKVLVADNQWHDETVVFDINGLVTRNTKLEFIVEDIGHGIAEEGDVIKFDDIRVARVIPDPLPARWMSPKSHVLIDKAPTQVVMLELASIAPGKICSFEIEVLESGSGKKVLQEIVKVEGKKTVKIDFSNYNPGSFDISVFSKGGKIGCWKLQKCPYRDNAVFVSDGVPYINGKPFLVIGIFHVGDPTINIINDVNRKLNFADKKALANLTRETLFKDLMARGFNSVHYPWDVASDEYFKTAQKYGLLVLSESRDKYDKVAAVKNYPNVLGWYAIDEPELDDIDKSVEIYEKYKNLDPYHPVMTAFNVGGLGYGHKQMVDIAMPDPYLFSSPNINFRDLQKYQIESLKNGLLDKDPATCVIYIPQLFTADVWKGHSPTYNQLRAEVYAAIHHGAKGFFYYAFWTSEKLSDGMPLNRRRKHWYLPESPLWNQVGALNHELMEIKYLILLGQTDSSIKVVGPVLGRGVILPDKQQYVTIINTGNLRLRHVKIEGLNDSQKLTPLFNSPSVRICGNNPHQLAIDLPGYGVAVYRVESVAEESSRK